jgi:peptidoglycan/LPS O-acetylase OafA/YrhL
MPLVALTSGYRPELDGLRALAVLAVLANHLAPTALPGGYLGVDLFFVLSGYVVTRSLAQRRQDSSAGSWVIAFYARRMRRLLPALLACILITLPMAALVMPAGEEFWGLTVRSAAAATAGASNLLFHTLNQGYFLPASDLNPYLHTWSLGVEEQFYLLYPVLLAARRWSSWLVVMLTAVSLILWLWQPNPAAPAAFFLLPSRFWELGLGCLLGFSEGRARAMLPRPEWLRCGLPLGLLLWALSRPAGLPWATPHAGALTVVLASVLLIAGLAGGGGLAAVLRMGWLQGLGRCSYGIYLWHWPLLVLARWTVGVQLVAQCTVAVVSVLVAALSYRWLELPLRRRSWGSTPAGGVGRGIALIAGSGLIVLGLGTPEVHAALYRGEGQRVLPAAFPQPPTAPQVAGTAINRTNCFDRFRQSDQLTDAMVARCTVLQPGSRRTLVLMGDSHAAHLTPALASVAQSLGSTLVVLSRGQCPMPAPGGGPCARFSQARLAWLERHGRSGDLLVLALSSHQLAGYPNGFLTRLATLVQRLRQRGITVILQAPLPRFPGSTATECTTAPQWFQPGKLARCGQEQRRRRAELAQERQRQLQQLQALEHRHRLVLWDPWPVLCSVDPCSTHRAGVRLFRDDDHLSHAGALLLSGSLEQRLRAVLAGRGATR